MKPINVIEVIEKHSAVLHSDGIKLYETIISEYKPNGVIEVSFKDLKYCTTAFLNASIGKFLSGFDKPEEALKNLNLTGFAKHSLIDDKLTIVIDNVINKANRHFEDNSIREFCS